MSEELFIRDIICQVLVDKKSKGLIYSVLNEFIPGYETIKEYDEKHDDENYVFKSEDEMLSHYTGVPNVSRTFYWNKYIDNPDKIMVGANITRDNQIVFSLTIDGTLKTEAKYYLRLKRFLNSDIGVITYVIPADYDSGNDFKNRYANKFYEFEK